MRRQSGLGKSTSVWLGLGAEYRPWANIALTLNDADHHGRLSTQGQGAAPLSSAFTSHSEIMTSQTLDPIGSSASGTGRAGRGIRRQAAGFVRLHTNSTAWRSSHRRELAILCWLTVPALVLHVISVTIYSLLGAFAVLPGLLVRQTTRLVTVLHRRVVAMAGLVTAVSGVWMASFYSIVPADSTLLHGAQTVFWLGDGARDRAGCLRAIVRGRMSPVIEAVDSVRALRQLV